MNTKVGEVFVRRSDEKVWTVKWTDGISIVLESPDNKLTMTDIHGLRYNYDKAKTNAT